MAGMRQGGEPQRISQAMSPLISSNAFTSQEENEKIEKGALSESGSGHDRTGTQVV